MKAYAGWSIHDNDEAKREELERLKAEETRLRDEMWRVIQRITELEDELRRSL